MSDKAPRVVKPGDHIEAGEQVGVEVGWGARREAVIAEVASKHGVPLERAERMVLGYEPTPGTLEYAHARFRESLRDFLRAVGDAWSGRGA